MKLNGLANGQAIASTERMPTNTSVSQWRCRCGASIKVVAEDGAKRGETTRVECPRCGDSQIVYGVRVISVEDDARDANGSR
jgi:hypothetical protein